MTINQGVDQRPQNNDRFMKLGKRLSIAFTKIDRANVQQKILEGLEALTKDAEFFANVAETKKVQRSTKRAKQIERLKK